MTYEEAHKFLEEKQREMTLNRHRYTEQEIEINGLSILSLERQIPKKPVYDSENRGITYCPHCFGTVKTTGNW